MAEPALVLAALLLVSAQPCRAPVGMQLTGTATRQQHDAAGGTPDGYGAALLAAGVAATAAYATMRRSTGSAGLPAHMLFHRSASGGLTGTQRQDRPLPCAGFDGCHSTSNDVEEQEEDYSPFNLTRHSSQICTC